MADGTTLDRARPRLSVDASLGAAEEMAKLTERVCAAMLAVFVVIPTGRLRRVLLRSKTPNVPTGLLREVRGFLPVRAGNVRTDDVARIYRESDLFERLREANELGGKYGACSFRSVCGGSRARAWAATGDATSEDPGCAYVPRGFGGST